MYAVVRRYDGVTDPAEAGRRVKEGFIPLLREVPGFVAYYWVNAGWDDVFNLGLPRPGGGGRIDEKG